MVKILIVILSRFRIVQETVWLRHTSECQRELTEGKTPILSVGGTSYGLRRDGLRAGKED